MLTHYDFENRDIFRIRQIVGQDQFNDQDPRIHTHKYWYNKIKTIHLSEIIPNEQPEIIPNEQPEIIPNEQPENRPNDHNIELENLNLLIN